MAEQGFLTQPHRGDLRDLIGRPFADGGTVSVSPTDSLGSAYRRMKQNDFSQLPVIEDGRAVGILDESDLLFALHSDAAALKRPVADFMSKSLRTLRPSNTLADVEALLRDGLVAIVADEDRLYGLITKSDVIEYLRNRNPR